MTIELLQLQKAEKEWASALIIVFGDDKNGGESHKYRAGSVGGMGIDLREDEDDISPLRAAYLARCAALEAWQKAVGIWH